MTSAPLRLILVFFAAGSMAAAGPARAGLRAGAVAVDITPTKLPLSMTGSFQDRQAIAVHDPLHARCLVLDDGRLRVAIVVCDSALITRDIFDAAKAIAAKTTGIPVSRMLMSATHTHTAPTIVQLAQCEPDLKYVEYLTRRIADSVQEANERLAPATIGWGKADEPSEVGNRRWFVEPGALNVNPFGKDTDKVRMNPPRDPDLLIRPAGPIDPAVSFLSVNDAEGRPLALLANYSLHYVGGIPPGELSADYYGEFARQISKRLEAPPSFVGIMSNGTSGDVNNYNFLAPRARAAPFERVTAVAEKIAELAHRSYRTIAHSGDLSLGMTERVIDLGVRRPDAKELRRARETLSTAASPHRLKREELYAQETIRLHEFPETVSLKLQALRIGELGIVAVPCEVFAEIGLDIKKQSPFEDTFTISLANGFNGYLPTPEQHALGGYETWRSGWSYLEVEASTMITKNVLEMLKELAD